MTSFTFLIYFLQIEKSEEKIQSLAVLMLHYCAGLQHCMEEMESDRSKPTAPAENAEVPVGEPAEKMEEGDKLGVDLPGQGLKDSGEKLDGL